MSFFKKLFLGSFALGFILIGGSGTQSSNMLLQGGGFIGLILGLVALYLFTKMAWRAMGCLPSFIVIMSIVCFVIYAIGGFNNGLGGVIKNLQTFVGGRTTISTPQISTPIENKTVKIDENFSEEITENPKQQKSSVSAEKKVSVPQSKEEQSGLMGFLNDLTKSAENNKQKNFESLPSFTSQVSVVTADTLNAQGHIIKLYGVAAPLINQTCANRRGQSYTCGQQAALWLQSWLKDNPISCRIISEKKGILYAACALGPYDIGAALVNAGWAVADTRETDIYAPYEQNAQDKRDGLWQGKFYKPWDWEAIQHRKPQYKIIPPQNGKRRSFFK